MTRDFTLECGKVIVKDYNSNIEVFFNGERVSHCFDGDIEYTVEENVEAFIEYEFEYNFQVTLSQADRDKLSYEMKGYFYPHSKECFEPELKKYRDLAGLSQSQLAKLSGVNVRMIQKYEQMDRDLSTASVTTVYKLSKALGVSIYQLMGWIE